MGIDLSMHNNDVYIPVVAMSLPDHLTAAIISINNMHNNNALEPDRCWTVLQQRHEKQMTSAPR